MKNQTVFITDYDLKRLKGLAESASHWPVQDMDIVSQLKNKLDAAKVVSQKEVPPYLVTMNCHVKVTDSITKKEMDFWLAYPDDALTGSDKISVLSETGVAVLGAKVGDVVKASDHNQTRQLRIAQLYYQPEEKKHYSL